MSKYNFGDRMNNQVLLLFFLFTIHTNSASEDVNNSKKFANYFRKQVEEIEDTTIIKTDESDDPRSNLVEFLIQNVKEVFGGLDEKTENATNISTTSILLFRPTNPTSVSPIPTLTAFTNSSLVYSDDDMVFENLSLTTLIDKKHHETNTEHYHNAERNELLHLSKDVKYFGDIDERRQIMNEVKAIDEKTQIMNEVKAKSPSNKTNNIQLQLDSADAMRSCIACNNVYLEDCYDPKNKLIPSIVCEHEDDLCYSMHTPFGIIDRGCFNINHNVTTYVCACNLCNHISISNMPYIFSNKHDWVDNVIELARMRNFRKSVSKDMSCLQCEINATIRVADMLDSANCLEGNIGNLPVEQCEEDEVCLVKAVRSDGYIWRGCSKAPLYNYWWSFCNNDLCNYDTIISIYDFVRTQT